MTAALKRRLTRSETVKDYYDEKIALLRQAAIPDDQIPSILLEGLPDSFRPYFYGRRFNTPSDWLQLALDIEVDMKTSHSQSKHNPNKSAHCTAKIEHCDQNKPKFNKKPRWPCKHCKAKSGSDVYHWHSECPNRPKDETQTRAQVSNTLADGYTGCSPVGNFATVPALIKKHEVLGRQCFYHKPHASKERSGLRPQDRH